MKRTTQFFAFICIIFLVASGVASSNSPSSASARTLDWAYSAIAELGQDRDIPGFDTSSQPNRNQTALLLARLLQHLGGEDHMQSRRFGVSQNVYLDSMIFSYNQRVAPEKALTASQVELLYRLVLEFSEELEILGYAIQDFQLLHAQTLSAPQGGLFTERKLLYSEQVLAAARRNAEQDALDAELFEPVTPPQTVVAEIVPEPISPRNLWTGQYSSTRFLPPASSFRADESVAETSLPIQIGGVEVSGALRPGTTNPVSVLDRSDPDEETVEGTAGYGVSMRLGDVSLQTAVDLGVDRDSLVPRTASTSVDLTWDWSDLFTLSAGYRQGVKLGENLQLEDPAAPLVTSVGVVVPINRGQVHLGMTQEWRNSLKLEGNSLPDEELAMSASAAELGLSYDFKNDSSLRLNYRFIDFTNMESGTEAEAAFSIKF